MARRENSKAHPCWRPFLRQAGHALFLADGNYVFIGEISIDFDLTLDELNPSNKTAAVSIRHVPPQVPEIKIPADWMRKPVADTVNNWVTVQKARNGKFLAAVGKETFDVKIRVDLADGKISSASMDNQVEMVERECADPDLASCGDSKPHSIHRQIEMSWKSRTSREYLAKLRGGSCGS